MRFILLPLGSFRIYLFGFSLVIGLLLMFSYLRSRRTEERYFVWDIVLWGGVGALLGARLFFIVADLPFYLSHPWEMLRVAGGGLSYWGALAGGVGGLYLLCRNTGRPLIDLLDEVVPAVALAQVPAWLGCDLHGIPTGVKWAIAVGGGIGLHPLPLYGALGSYALFVWLRGRSRHATRRGELFLDYLVLQSFVLFVLELFRAAPVFGPFTLGGWLALLAFVTGLWVNLRQRGGFRARAEKAVRPASPFWKRLIRHGLAVFVIVIVYHVRVGLFGI